ncbi:MAG: hypothetical protein PSV35_07095, partial [bacterium]|nr:hypothetical protein [bacterium]
NNVSVLTMELDSIVKNAILQQQAEITQLLKGKSLTTDQIDEFSKLITNLDNISSFISGSPSDLKAKYGATYTKTTREAFIQKQEDSFTNRMSQLYEAVDLARKNLALVERTKLEVDPYVAMKDRIIERRRDQISPEFVMPSGHSNALAEAESVAENQSQSQSQSQTQNQNQNQAQSFSEVNNEEAMVEAVLTKQPDIVFEPIYIDYLTNSIKLNALPLANKTAHMTHLFLDSDPIRCSPKYLQKDPSPPIHFFVAREQGNPKVILINQDEANQFKAAAPEGWSLYDIRLGSAEQFIEPIVGLSVMPLTDPLMKKMNFAAFRLPVAGESVVELAHSLEGVFTPQQLKPSLEIDDAQSSRKDRIFNLEQWGFTGKEKQQISMEIAPQSNIPANGKTEFSEQGIGISIGKGDVKATVFVSSALNDRFNSASPKIKSLAEQIETQRENAIAENSKLRGLYNDLRKTKNELLNKVGTDLNPDKVRGDDKKMDADKALALDKERGSTCGYNQRIKILKEQREQLIKERTQELKDRFPSAMHSLLDMREWDDGNASAKLVLSGGASCPSS